jgi:RNA polymerase sigma-70 factor (ECF subfamily)
MGPHSLSATQFEALYRRTAPELHAYLSRRVGEAASDLLSEVFVIAWKRREELPGKRLHRAWLFGVARRVALSHSRSALRREDAERGAFLTPAPTEDPAREAARTVVREALSGLNEIDRELIQLTEWEELTIVEAAIAIGMTAGTARVRLHRARQRLAAHPAMVALIEQRGTKRVSQSS